MSVRYTPIGLFNSPFENVEGFSHIIVISHLHQIKGYYLVLKPILDTKHHGIFATRSPNQPNPIGFSVMKLIGVTSSTIRVQGVDVVNNTPVIDIKPYVADFYIWEADRFGWFEGKSENASHHLSDDRFA